MEFHEILSEKCEQQLHQVSPLLTPLYNCLLDYPVFYPIIVLSHSEVMIVDSWLGSRMDLPVKKMFLKSEQS